MSSIEDTVKEVVDKIHSDPRDLPERTQEKEIEIEQVATTDDAYSFPCYKVRIGDSWINLVHNTIKDRLTISHVWMEYQGDFSDIMDEIVEEFETKQIKFTMVINDNLQKVLNGFEEKTEYHEALNEKMTVLEGEWSPGASKQKDIEEVGQE